MGDDRERDLAAIEELHARDVAASRAGDHEALRRLFDDEALLLPPGGEPVRGAAAIDASFARMEQAYADVEVLEYDQQFDEVLLLGDHAVECGSLRGSSRRVGSNEIQRSSYNLMRVLRRQPDGSWKVFRTIWNARSDAGSED